MPTLAEPLPPPPFTGFPPDALTFFAELTANQDKAWFTANRARYDEGVVAPAQSLLGDLTQKLAKTKVPFRGSAKSAIFRIHRDVRFSKDKSPYKTHFGIALTRDGEKLSPGVLYVHLDPAGSFAAAGFYMPDPPLLGRMRTAIAKDAAGWKKIEGILAKKGLVLGREEALSRPPRGFEDAAVTVIEALKLKSFIVRRDLKPADIGSARLPDIVSTLAQDAAPLLTFGWAVL